MKCREMNPGNLVGDGEKLVDGEPSMKCREMNPGNKPHTDLVIRFYQDPQ